MSDSHSPTGKNKGRLAIVCGSPNTGRPRRRLMGTIGRRSSRRSRTPLIGAGIGLFILPRTWSLLKQAFHDLHIWTITSGVEAMSAHVTVENPVQGDRTLSELRNLFKSQFKIDHTTIQLEEEKCSDFKDEKTF